MSPWRPGRGTVYADLDRGNKKLYYSHILADRPEAFVNGVHSSFNLTLSLINS